MLDTALWVMVGPLRHAERGFGQMRRMPRPPRATYRESVSAPVISPPPRRLGRPERPVPPARRPVSKVLRRRRRHRLLARALLASLLTLAVGVSAFVAGLLSAPFDEKQVPPPPRPVLLLASDGTQIGSIRPPVRREIVPADAIPDVMRNAIIAAEDERFLQHGGVDPVGIARAFLRDVTGGRSQGGSTLTQQYVKNVYVGSERTLTRKIREAAIAVRLEQRESKQQILTNYLNVLFLGNGTYGVQAAARYYFGVDVRDLDLDPATGQRDRTLGLARAAMLAGIAPAPSAYNPVASLDLARGRQRYVLNRMVAVGQITPDQAGAAFTRPLQIVKEQPVPTDTTAPEFTDLVTEQLRAQYASANDEDLLFRGGLRVQTTLDSAWQQAVSQAAREVLPNPTDPQAAVVAIDWRNGDVKALTTLRRYPERSDGKGNVRPALDGYQRGGLDLAVSAHRSTGSTIKPFTLAVALQKGHTLDERRRAPACDTLPNPGGKPDPYRFCNAGESGYTSSLTLRQALQRSVNTVFVPLAAEVGRGDIANLLQAAGAKADPANPIRSGNLSFGLGAGVDVTPLSMANAFGTLINGGVRVPPRFLLETRNAAGGVVQPAAAPQGNRVLPQDIAGQVVDAMSGVTADAGTAPAARQPFPVYGKTGTTDNSVDAWFIGCVKDPYNLCLATWMGFEDQSCDGVKGSACGGMLNVQGVRPVYGGTLPARIFARAMDLYRSISAAKTAPPPAATAAPAPAPPPGPNPAAALPVPTAPAAAAPSSAAPAPRPTPSSPPAAPASTTAPPSPSPRPTVPLPPPPAARATGPPGTQGGPSG